MLNYIEFCFHTNLLSDGDLGFEIDFQGHLKVSFCFSNRNPHFNLGFWKKNRKFYSLVHESEWPLEIMWRSNAPFGLFRLISRQDHLSTLEFSQGHFQGYSKVILCFSKYKPIFLIQDWKDSSIQRYLTLTLTFKINWNLFFQKKTTNFDT